jgi:predicted phage-related endonuclease
MDRTRGIGGSDASRIMSGNWLELWEEKTGRREAEDLSGVLQVQIGIITEELNCRWFERETGHEVSRKGCTDLKSDQHDFLVGNIDGWVLDGVIECKHVSAFAKDEQIVDRYYPQLQHYLELTNSPRGFLSVIYGNHRWEFYQVERDQIYLDELITREIRFWWHIQQDIPPKSGESHPIRIAFDQLRTIDMTGNNHWATLASDWTDNRAAAAHFADAAKGLKSLVPDDVKLASGHGIKISRARNGALTVREAR